MMDKCAVFSCRGLGDGLFSLVLSNNLVLNGYPTTTFHPFFQHLQSWFRALPIKPFSSHPEHLLAQFDQIFIFHETSPWIQDILSICLEKYREKTTVITLLDPFWEETRFDKNIPFLDNIYNFCSKQLKLPLATKSNGITPPPSCLSQRYPNRVILHPTSSRKGKNWPRKRFLKLYDALEKRGFEPVFILTKEERVHWDPEGRQAPDFPHLEAVSSYLYESGFFIGNDSGLGHLASCLKVPTVTLARQRAFSRFWRPSWTTGELVFAPKWIPNLKRFRLRDHYWKYLIPVRQVLTAFEKLQKRSRDLQATYPP